MSDEIFENLRKSVIEYDANQALNWARKAVEEEIDPVEATNALIGGIREVGEGFGRGELFLPELVMAAEAMKSAMPILNEAMRRRGKMRKTLGKIVIGTVYGDIHNIGKDMVATLCMAEGFEVIDLGVDVPAEQFVKSVRENNPDILAMSALLTMTAPEQRRVIEKLKKEGLRERLKIMVGGGAITDDFAKDIGADGYSPTAVGAAKLAKTLSGKR